MSLLLDLVNTHVLVLTCDGRILLGYLRGFDNSVNLILEDALERVFSPSQGVELLTLGLFLIRGENVASVGTVNKEKDEEIKWSEVTAEPLKPIVH
jgi:U6 snRNA-associated Sm-like protein LSm8